MLEDVLIAGEAPADEAAILALNEEAFGPGRFSRAAERVREMAGGHDPTLSFAAWRGDELLGSVRMTPVAFACRDAASGSSAPDRPDRVAGHLLGPLAVRPHAKTRGIGGALIARACVAASDAGGRFVLLVGDEPYYGRHGFARISGPVMPRPVDPARLLVRWYGDPEPIAGPPCPWPRRSRTIRP